MISRMDDGAIRDEAVSLAAKLNDRVDAVINDDVQPKMPQTASPDSEQDHYPTHILTAFDYSVVSTISAGTDMSVEGHGEFVAPDKATCVRTMSVGGAVRGPSEIVISGQQAWMNTSNGPEPVDVNESYVHDDLENCLGSDVYWQGWGYFWVQDSGIVMPDHETINGVLALHYSLVDSMGKFVDVGFLPPVWKDLDIAAFDVWFAESGGWPVAFELDVSGTSAMFDAAGFEGLTDDASGHVEARLRFDITNPNDPAIAIALPSSSQ